MNAKPRQRPQSRSETITHPQLTAKQSRLRLVGSQLAVCSLCETDSETEPSNSQTSLLLWTGVDENICSRTHSEHRGAVTHSPCLFHHITCIKMRIELRFSDTYLHASTETKLALESTSSPWSTA